MSDGTYNGWKNYQTWAAGLWLSNSEAEYNACSDMVKDAGSVARGAESIKEYILDALDAMEEYQSAGLFTDLLQHAIGQIDWYEVAESFKPDDWEDAQAGEASTERRES